MPTFHVPGRTDGEPIGSIPPIQREPLIQSFETPVRQRVEHGWESWKDTSEAGRGVTLAVLDTGVDEQHPELEGRLKWALDMTGGDGRDRNGHGTHCCGIIAGQTCGLAPKASLVSIKVLGDNGSGSASHIVAGIRKAVSLGVDMISMSLGMPQPFSALQDAIRQAQQAGILCFAATGNNAATRVLWPAAYNGLCVAVGAVDYQEQRASFSNYDACNVVVDMVDYGVSVISCVPGGGYAPMSGTSMATPMAVGMAANRMSYEAKHPGAAPIKSLEDLCAICEDLGKPGLDKQYGCGIMRGHLAFPEIEQPQPPTEPAPSSVRGTLHTYTDGRVEFIPE